MNTEANRDYALAYKPPPYGVVCMRCGVMAFQTTMPPLLDISLEDAYQYQMDSTDDASPLMSSDASPLTSPDASSDASSSFLPRRLQFNPAEPGYAPIRCWGCHEVFLDVRTAAGGWQALTSLRPGSRSSLKQEGS